ncbi:MAG: flagellar hook-basal body complex protein FliE [Mariprofundaceae bacterium]
MSVNAINSAIKSPLATNLQPPEGDQKGGDFATLLKAYTEQMNVEHHQASKAAVDLATGKGGNTSEALLAIQKADLSFQMMLSVRNKLVDAYREVMRMQV